jgi:AcrR family transcriptional regulator
VSTTSGRRAAQAQATRHEIVAAARRLFAERGYAATTVRDIASEAGVSVQTVYDSVGSKRHLVETLNDVIDAEAGIDAIAGPVMASDDTDAIARVSARITRAIVEHAGDIVRLGLTASHSEPALQHVIEEGYARHRAGADAVVARLRAQGVLPTDRSDEQIAEAVAAVTDVEFVIMLRDRYGWSFDRIEAFVTELVLHAVGLETRAEDR